MKKIFYYIVAIVLLHSCSSNKTTADLQKIFGQQMVLPVEGQWRIVDRDTMITPRVDKPKMLIYYNAQGCTSCRLKELADWKEFLTQTTSWPSDSSNVEFMFVFATGRDMRNLTFCLLQYNFDTPVLCDINKEFESKNLMPDNEIFHCFLLDKSNKVCLIGSPLGNPEMWQLYKQRIAEINNKQT